MKSLSPLLSLLALSSASTVAVHGTVEAAEDPSEPGGIEDAKIFLSKLRSCAAVELDLDTCLSEKTIGLIIEGMMAEGDIDSDGAGADDGGVYLGDSNVRRALLGLAPSTSASSGLTNSTETDSYHEDDGSGNDVGTTPHECKPEIDVSAVEYLVSEAANICDDESNGTATANQGDIEATTDAFVTLFVGSDQCWKDVCEETQEEYDGYDGYEGEGYEDPFIPDEQDIITIIFDEALTCPGVQEIDPSSCLVQTALGMMSQMEEEDDGTAALSSIVEKSLLLPGHRHLIHNSGMCFPPEIDEEPTRMVLTEAASICSNGGVEVSTSEIDLAVSSVLTAFSGDCWDKICHRMVTESLLYSLGAIAECSGEALDMDSCLVKETMFRFAEKGANFSFLTMNMEICSFPNLEYQQILEHVNAASDNCTPLQQEEIEDVASKLSLVFDSAHCFQDVCPTPEDELFRYEDDGNGSTDQLSDVEAFFNRLIIDHLAECSKVTFDEATCLDVTLEGMILGGGSEGEEGWASSYPASSIRSAASSAGSPQQHPATIVASTTNRVAAGIRHHLHQQRRKNGFASTSTTTSRTRRLATAIDTSSELGGEFGRELSYDQHEYDDSTYGYDQDTYHGDEEAMYCEIPEVDGASIEFLVQMAKGMCLSDGHEVSDASVEAAITTYTTFFGAEKCWESLCHEATYSMLIAKYIKDCAEIDLPIPAFGITSGGDEGPFDPPTSPDDIIIGCMIDFAMSTSHSVFGLPEPEEGSLDKCYPPGHDNASNICPVSIAPIALQHCADHVGPPDYPPHDLYGSMSFGYEQGDFDWDWGEDLFFRDDFFFSMSMSMSMDYGDHGSDDDKPPPPPYDPDRDARLMEDFCILLDELSSDNAKQCLLPLCEMSSGDTGDDAGDDDESDLQETVAPTEGPTAASSTAPSTLPSVSPSYQPSMFASTIPSSSPSSFPSFSPTALETPGIVEIRYEAKIQVNNLDVSEIPMVPGEALDEILNVLKEVISKFIPDNSEARIISIGGVPIPSGGITSNGSDGGRRLRRYRLLQDGTEIEFEIVSTLECMDATCSDADTISSEVSTVISDLSTAIASGEFGEELVAKASQADVGVLSSVTVVSDSFEASDPDITITEGGDSSGAASTYPFLLPLAAAAIVAQLL